jgi:hypothetical protein
MPVTKASFSRSVTGLDLFDLEVIASTKDGFATVVMKPIRD